MSTLASFLSRLGKTPAGESPTPKAPVAPTPPPPAYWNLDPVVVWTVVHSTCAHCHATSTHTNPIPLLRTRGRKGEIHDEPLVLREHEHERIRLYRTFLSHIPAELPRCHECLSEGSPDPLALQQSLNLH